MPWWDLMCYNNNKFKILDKLINEGKTNHKIEESALNLNKLISGGICLFKYCMYICFFFLNHLFEYFMYVSFAFISVYFSG